MKKEFPGYFPPSEAELKNRWLNAIIVLDASFLLGLYNLTPVTRGQIITALKPLKSRIFLPNQAVKEFHRNRLGVIKKLRDEHEQLTKELNTVVERLIRRGQKTPALKRTTAKALEVAAKTVGTEIEGSKRKAEGLLKKDDILDALLAFLDGRAGKPFSEKELKDIYKDGQQRYSQKIPPGYKDDAKPDPERYGDLVIWKEILKKGTKHHIFFVTGDEKEDWWWIFESSKIGPRPELITEALENGLLSFHLYTGDRFLENARQYNNAKITPSSIQEFRESQVSSTPISVIPQSSQQPSGLILTAGQPSSQGLDWQKLIVSQPGGSFVIGPNPYSNTGNAANVLTNPQPNITSQNDLFVSPSGTLKILSNPSGQFFVSSSKPDRV